MIFWEEGIFVRLLYEDDFCCFPAGREVGKSKATIEDGG